MRKRPKEGKGEQIERMLHKTEGLVLSRCSLGKNSQKIGFIT
jgi:hypothetical protein